MLLVNFPEVLDWLQLHLAASTLLYQDRQRKEAQRKLEELLQEGLDSDTEPVTSAYWYNLRTSVLGINQLLANAEYAFAQLAITPNMGKVVQLGSSNMGEICQWRIKNFRDYLIFYKVQDDRVEILRVLHGARDLEEILPFLDE